MGLHKPFNFVNVDALVREWIADYFFDPDMMEDDDEEEAHEYEVPGG